MEFVKWPKTPRLNRDCIITEKLDGTNAQIYIEHRSLVEAQPGSFLEEGIEVGDFVIAAGSRNRWVSVGKDNYGFAGWVSANRDELIKLGPGRHYGEWWGQGIQRKYGLTEKRFSLFNTSMWTDDRPACCHVVPTLYEGPFDTSAIDIAVNSLRYGGSVAAPGFMDPEGIIVFHTASQHSYKVTLNNDGQPKGFDKRN
jgi:hypothetical protein